VLSGHRELLGKIKHPLIDVDGVLALFGDAVRTTRRAYVRALKGAREEEWRDDSPGRLPWRVHEVDRRVEPVALTAWIDELGRSTGLERPRMESQDFLSRSCRLLDITMATVAGPGKGRELSRQRYLIAALGIERWGLTMGATFTIAPLVGDQPLNRCVRIARLRTPERAATSTQEITRIEQAALSQVCQGLDKGSDGQAGSPPPQRPLTNIECPGTQFRGYPARRVVIAEQ